jgi:hypothetical protein
MNRRAREGNCRTKTGDGFPDLSAWRGKNTAAKSYLRAAG